MTYRRAVATSVVPLLLLAGCSSGEKEPATTGPSVTSSGTGSRTADDAVDYPEAGVDLVDPPELKGVYQQALQTYVDFERGRRLTAREGRLDRLLSFNATGDVVDPYREALRRYGDRGTYAGDVVIEFVDARTRGDKLLLELCVDATGLEVPDGAPTLLGEATRAPQHVEVSNIVGPWRVTKVAPLSGSC